MLLIYHLKVFCHCQDDEIKSQIKFGVENYFEKTLSTQSPLNSCPGAFDHTAWPSSADEVCSCHGI